MQFSRFKDLISMVFYSFILPYSIAPRGLRTYHQTSQVTRGMIWHCLKDVQGKGEVWVGEKGSFLYHKLGREISITL